MLRKVLEVPGMKPGAERSQWQVENWRNTLTKEVNQAYGYKAMAGKQA